MGWRLRRVFGAGPIRGSMSRRGIGWSIGVPGFRAGISATGHPYLSIGIPGLGLYWTKHFGRPQLARQEAQPSPPKATPATQTAPPPQVPQPPWWKDRS